MVAASKGRVAKNLCINLILKKQLDNPNYGTFYKRTELKVSDRKDPPKKSFCRIKGTRKKQNILKRHYWEN